MSVLRPVERKQGMTRISGKIWQGRGTCIVLLAVGLLGGWWSHATVSVVGAQESSPFAGMVEVPGGQFIMGRDGGPANEQPAHQMFLPTFYIDRNLVTIAEFATFVQAKGPTGPQGEMYLDVRDPDNRIQHQDGVWSPGAGFAHIRLAKSVGSGRWRIVNGDKSTCPVRQSGKKRRAARMAALIPGQRPATAGFGLLWRLPWPDSAYRAIPQWRQPIWGAGHGRAGVGMDDFSIQALSLRSARWPGGSQHRGGACGAGW